LKSKAEPVYLMKPSESRPAWGAWIEILIWRVCRSFIRRRAPHGARGLKYRVDEGLLHIPSRAPHGARGLKCRRPWCVRPPPAGRAPHGARGLKYSSAHRNNLVPRSRPAWGAWIEIPVGKGSGGEGRSRPAWGAWIEINARTLGGMCDDGRAPHGARGLKCGNLRRGYRCQDVAPRMGRVD